MVVFFACMYHMCAVQCPWMPEEGIRSPRVTDGCQIPELRSSGGAASTLKYSAISPAPLVPDFE